MTLKKILWKVSLIITLCELVLWIAAFIGDTWWVIYDINGRRNFGLWKTCTQINVTLVCKTRNSVLKFKEELNNELDSMIIALVISVTSMLLSIASLMFMLVRRKNPNSWSCGAILFSAFTFINASMCFSAVLFAETRFKDRFKSNKHGWSIILVWIKVFFSIISFMCSCAIFGAGKKENFEITNYTRKPRSQNVLDNLGYVHDD
ncbi:uncharacterized protein LOC124814586 isoform X2 [Hydra vulgaris]|uniref:Uncharacterized protein LOC124814586 isoform X2 n=1 Tax=Hydra vulgaris TaxID=6087 RepID=A0ABM4C247_HYDVU